MTEEEIEAIAARAKAANAAARTDVLALIAALREANAIIERVRELAFATPIYAFRFTPRSSELKED